MPSIKRLLSRFWDAANGFMRHDGMLMAAAIAYYLAVSFFPLLLVLVAALGYALAWTAAGQNAQERILAVIAEQASPNLAVEVQQSLAVVRDRAPTGGSVGFAILLFAAIAIFNQFDYAFDRIWRLNSHYPTSWRGRIARILLTRVKALVMLLCVGAFLLAVTIASVVWEGLQSVAAEHLAISSWLQAAIRLGMNLLFNLLGFAAIYRFLPRAPIRWKHALAGGLTAAILWEIGREVLASYLFRQNYPTAYGVIGSFLAIMLWAYYATIVLLFGAEFVRAMDSQEIAVPADGTPQRKA